MCRDKESSKYCHNLVCKVVRLVVGLHRDVRDREYKDSLGLGSNQEVREWSGASWAVAVPLV